MTPAGVHLREVDTGNVRAACELDVESDQRSFVAPVATSLAEAYVEPDIAWPRLIYDGDALVGFVMGEFAADGSVWLWRLNIAAGQQGKGYGRFAVGELAREAHQRGANRLMTSYVPGDAGPAGFYERLGFVETGEIDGREIVLALELGPVAGGT